MKNSDKPIKPLIGANGVLFKEDDEQWIKHSGALIGLTGNILIIEKL